MAKSKAKQAEEAQERREQIAALKRYFPRGRTVYTVIHRAASNGMSRHIGVLAPVIGRTREGRRLKIVNVTWRVAKLLGYKFNRDSGGMVVVGCGMDMGFAVAYELANALYGDGYALNHEWA